MFPKEIFQTWKTKTVDHPVLHQWQESWLLHNPSYKYVLWDDEDNRLFIERYFNDFLPIFDGYDKAIKRADAIRYFYLYTYGGIYADLDFECLKSFNDILENGDADIYLGSMGIMDSEKFSMHNIPNAIMISKPSCNFWKIVINALKTLGSDNTLAPEVATGPVLLKVCLLFYLHNENYSTQIYGKDIFSKNECEHTNKICILPESLLYPINWDNKEHVKYRTKLLTHQEAIDTFPDSYAVTYWMHSW